MSPLEAPVFAQHQELLGLRRRHSWLHYARTRVLDVADEHIALASTAGGERIVTVPSGRSVRPLAMSTAWTPTILRAGVR